MKPNLFIGILGRHLLRLPILLTRPVSFLGWIKKLLSLSQYAPGGPMPKQIIYFLTAATFFLNLPLNADSPVTNLNESLSQVSSVIEGFYLFEGDKHGDFKGNLVAVLSDGSAWKGHPDSCKILRCWEVGNSIHIKVRTSWYWFKREHKFLLYNHDRKESVKAMLVQYEDLPLKISYTSGVYPTAMEPVPHWGYDGNGNYVILYWTYEPCNFRKYLLLSDGSEWTISNNFKYFDYGANVYIGFNTNGDKPTFFLITGQEREAKWSWAQSCSRIR